MGGVVVRGVAGRRGEYRPVVSRLTDSPEPLAVARAFRTHFGLVEIYLADLDAIAGAPPALDAYSRLRSDGFRLWVDAGVRTAADARRLAAAGLEGVVAGSETLSGPDELRRAVEEVGPGRLLFSLDLKGGRLLGDAAAWGTDDGSSVAARAVGVGVRRLIVLDLERVGVGSGVGTEALCARLAEAHPGIELVAGGGLHGPDDLDRLSAASVSAALVASALHDGR